VLSEVVRAAREAGVTQLVGEFIPSPKNKMVEKHYQKLGFTLLEDKDGHTTWGLDVAAYEHPDLPVAIVRD